MKFPMRVNRTMIIVFAAFAAGTGLGYMTFDTEPETASTPAQASQFRPYSSHGTLGDKSPSRKSRPSARREAPPSIMTDRDGNLMLPTTIADRFEIMVLSGLKANREDLRVLGMSEEQIDHVQQIVDQTLQSCFEREKSVIQDFTASGDEIVRMIPGDPAAAATEKQRLLDAIQLMGGTKTALLEEKLVGALAYMTRNFGAMDSFFRVSRQEGSSSSERQLSFERIQLFLGHGEPPPSPGSSFMGYAKKYRFMSSCRFVGKAPPEDTAHLLQDGQWEHLLRPKSLGP